MSYLLSYDISIQRTFGSEINVFGSAYCSCSSEFSARPCIRCLSAATIISAAAHRLRLQRRERPSLTRALATPMHARGARCGNGRNNGDFYPARDFVGEKSPSYLWLGNGQSLG